MIADDLLKGRRFKLGLVLWVAGMIGAVVITLGVLPTLVAEHRIPVPLWLLTVASLGQTGVFIALAVWAGTALSGAVGLRAPTFEAFVTSRPLWPALRGQVAPSLIAGACSGALLLAFNRYAPPALAAAQERFNPSLAGRVLYGGVTEELLLRWGLMTTLVWLTWRFVQRRRGAPGAAALWFGIVVSALLFGAGHLPAATALVGDLSAGVVTYVVGANTAFGILFGYLFWRYGLEAAMIAHATAHVVAYVAMRMLS